MKISIENKEKILTKLNYIYGKNKSQQIILKIESLINKYSNNKKTSNKNRLSENDLALITYGDNIAEENEIPLKTLCKFADEYLKNTINIIHLLPFYPYSSDDGFSVIDYKKVNPNMGDWEDIENIGSNFDLMYDLVANHISAKSKWFQEYLKDNSEYKDYFIAVDKDTDISSVTRARAHPLLTKFNKNEEEVYIWTTFSADQIDINYANEKVLLEIIDVILFYASKNVRIIRLDAIGHAWKEIGTSCINLKETHMIIQLFREILDEVFPEVLLITETNVPYKENLSYFGDGYNEAQLVYQFALPTLVIHTYITGDASKLLKWADIVEVVSEETTYFNVLATHDGVGVVPVKGILSEEEVNKVIENVESKGGFVSYKDVQKVKKEPYEMNITYYSVLADPEENEEINIAKYISSQAILLSLIGVPGIYIHSLFGTENYQEGVKKTGQRRTINRRKFNYNELKDVLADKNSRNRKIFDKYLELIKIRKTEKAFHPNGQQKVLFIEKGIFSLLRSSPDGHEKIIALHNVTNMKQNIKIPKEELALNKNEVIDLVSKEKVNISDNICLNPYQVMWLNLRGNNAVITST